MCTSNARLCCPIVVFAAVILLGCSNEDSKSAGETDSGTDTNSGTDSDTGSGTVDDSAGVSDTGSGADTESTLSGQYPGDLNIENDPAVLFHDDFETGWGRWDSPQADTRYLTMQNGSAAHSGTGYLQSRVTVADLEETQYISSSSRVAFARQDEIYWRFYARMPEVAPNPHHWVRVSAGRDGWESSGLANTVPDGDDGFWFDFDISNDDVFNFYVYWHEMRSGRCNDGSAIPGCEGDQGTTYYYGNVFRPPSQQPYLRDTWFCIEIRAQANAPSQNTGELTFWINDQLVGDYRPGYPNGTWLRDSFHTDGCTFFACTDPVPFEGFNFRTSADVGFKSVILDAYYERGTSANKREELESRGLTVSDNQTIYYDDIVVATKRIGCQAP
ncbi:MAG: hypothetical protein JXR76_28640 [Deltaproteobacteria bacterium]|nr:hypothetical protein [Deltaproteobacteria bacterium]